MHTSTFILLIVILISLLLSVIMDIMSKHFSILTLLGYIFGLAFYFSILLDQECVHTVGPCDIWGWIRLVFILIFFVLLIVIKVLIISSYKKETVQTKEENES